ncbi:AAA family ATPase, partial [bacterium]
PTFKELEWVVEGLIPRGYLTLLAGRPKDGKTCLATALGVAVAQGLPFAGMKTQASKVLYFYAEESPQEWYAAFKGHLPECVESFGMAFVAIAVDSDFYLQALRAAVIAQKVGLIVVDPLLGAIMNGDFGNCARARKILFGLKTICRETGVAIVVVHHARERRGKASRVAENPQLAATASLNVVLNWRPHPRGRLVSLDVTGRGQFANRKLRLLSDGPCSFHPYNPWDADPQLNSPRGEKRNGGRDRLGGKSPN